jgi:hypothetical protein
MGRDITYEHFGERLIEALPELEDDYLMSLEYDDDDPYSHLADALAWTKDVCQDLRQGSADSEDNHECAATPHGLPRRRIGHWESTSL